MANITRFEDRTADLFTQMRKELDTLFGAWFGRMPALHLPTWPAAQSVFTPCELQETEGEFVVKMEVPGVTEKDIKVTFQGESLTIQGERKEEKVEGKGNTRYTERTYGSFMRVVPMPAAVKTEEIRARCKDGVIEVHLPKAQKTAAREVKVEAGA